MKALGSNDEEEVGKNPAREGKSQARRTMRKSL